MTTRHAAHQALSLVFALAVTLSMLAGVDRLAAPHADTAALGSMLVQKDATPTRG